MTKSLHIKSPNILILIQWYVEWNPESIIKKDININSQIKRRITVCVEKQ
jgi:hypothetical protein